MKKSLILLFSILCISLNAQIPTLDLSKRVFDFEQDFSNPNKIEETIFRIEQNNHIKILVITTSDYFDQSTAFDLVQELTKINKFGNNSGYILVFSKTKRHTELQVSRRVEGYLPDMICKQITETGSPYFKKKQYDDGILRILSEIETKTGKPEVQKEIAENNELAKSHKEEPIELGWFWDILAILGLSILGAFGWNLKGKKEKAKKEEELRKQAEAEFLERKKLADIEIAKLKQKQQDEWNLYKNQFLADDKLNFLKVKINSLKDKVKKDFVVSDNYLSDLDSKIQNIEIYIKDDSYQYLERLKILILELEQTQYHEIQQILISKKQSLIENLIKVQNLYNAAKHEISLNQSQYNNSSLNQSKYEACFNENVDIFERLNYTQNLISTYDSIIRWKEIKRREEERIEAERLLRIRQEAELKQRQAQEAIDRIARMQREAQAEEEDRIARKKRQDEDEANRVTFTFNPPSTSDFSDFGGGGGGTDW